MISWMEYCNWWSTRLSDSSIHIFHSLHHNWRVFEDLPYFLKASQCPLMKSKFLPNQPSPSPSALSSPNTISLALCASATVAFFAVLPWHWALSHCFGLDFLAGQGTLKSLLQHHSSKALILRCSAFFMVQLSHPHMTTGKTIALTICTFVGKVLSLLFIGCLGLS